MTTETKAVEPKPRYEHDCKSCVFLGSTIANNHHADLYFCPSEPTVIARYSSEGSDYSSGIQFGESGAIAELHVALRRARDRGLLPTKQALANAREKG